MRITERSIERLDKYYNLLVELSKTNPNNPLKIANQRAWHKSHKVSARLLPSLLKLKYITYRPGARIRLYYWTGPQMTTAITEDIIEFFSTVYSNEKVAAITYNKLLKANGSPVNEFKTPEKTLAKSRIKAAIVYQRKRISDIEETIARAKKSKIYGIFTDATALKRQLKLENDILIQLNK